MNQTILVLDDEPAIRRLLKAMLEEFGFTVDMASTTREADQRIADREYAALVVDYNLPEEDGVSWLTRISEGGNHTPWILISGRDYEDLKVVTRHLRGATILTKPIELMTLISSVQHAIAGSAS